MPTIRQMNRLRASGWNDDNRIGYGGFEAPNGRQWWELESWYEPPGISPEPPGKLLGYYITDFEAGTDRFIHTYMLESYTDADDQDWQDFLKMNMP